MNVKRLIIMALLVVMLATLIGASSAQDSKVVTIIFTQEPDTLSPLYTGMWFSGITTELWLAKPWVFDDNLAATPVLVKEIPSADNGGISADNKVITLNLREDLTWSDGEPLTSADFLFTVEMWLADDNLVQTRYPFDSAVESVDAPDEFTVVYTFAEPFAPWLPALSIGILPEHVLRPVFEDEGTLDDAAWNRAPTVSSGPFVFVEWESGGHLFFERNENFFGEAPLLDGVFIRIVEDDASQVNALINGDGHIGTFISYSDLGQLEDAGVGYALAASGYNEAWLFNTDPETAHPAMTDVNVRKALQMAAPRQLVNETLLEGRTYVPGTFWEGSAYDNPMIEPPPYDPEAAAAMLDEAGWVDSNGDGTRDKDGEELVLRYLTPPRQVRMDTQVVVQQAFAEIGIGLTLENPSYDVFWNTFGAGGPIATGQYDIGQWSNTTSSFPDPDTSDFLCAEIASEDNPEGNNWSGYCEEELDALFIAQSQTVDGATRLDQFHRIGELMSEAAIWTGIWYDPDVWAVSGRLVDVLISGEDPFWNSYAWDLAD